MKYEVGLIVIAIFTACTYADDEVEIEVQAGLHEHGSVVGLAIEVDNGTGVPLVLRRGQRFYLNQIDLRASTPATRDDGVAGLAERGDFRDLAWHGISLDDEEPILLANPANIVNPDVNVQTIQFRAQYDF